MIRREAECREPVRPDWAVCKGKNVAYFHTSAVICQEEGAVKETVSVCVSEFWCVYVCVRALASGEKSCLFAEGTKTITTHLVAAIVAYTGARGGAAKTHSELSRGRTTQLWCTTMSVLMETAKGEPEGGMFRLLINCK